MMVDYPVMVEFARDVVDDERHSELEDQLLAIFMHSNMISTHLNDNANQNKSLVFTL